MTGRAAEVPSVHVLLYAPTQTRRWWWFAGACPQCGDFQFGRARTREDVPGVRRGGCGHRVDVVVAQVLGGAP